MKKRIIGISLSIITVFMLLISSCGMSRGSGTLVVGVREDVPHFSFRSENTGRCYGFEIDLAEKIAEKLGYDGIRVVVVDPQNREEYLEDDKVDCIIACYSYSDERAKKVDFSESYASSKLLVFAEESSNIKNMSMLENLTIGIKSGAKGETELYDLLERHQIQGTKVVPFDSYEELILRLEWGDIDAAAIDDNMLYEYWTEGMVLVDNSYYSENYCVATAKGNPLCGQISEVISELKENGEMAALYDKWGIGQFGK